MPDAAMSTIQSLCELGQRALLATDYLAAEKYLVAADSLAWDAADYDALARLYMPLQEARRQRRQLSSDGPFATIVARTPEDSIDPLALAGRFERGGQLIVAGHGTIGPAVTLRTLAAQRGLYLDLPLAAAYCVGDGVVILLVPTPDVALPAADRIDSIDALLRHAPPHAIALPIDSLPPDQPRGDPASFGYVMSLWESLHAPYLALADAATDSKQKLLGYRQAICVDYACEFAHQRFSDVARSLTHKK